MKNLLLTFVILSSFAIPSFAEDEDFYFTPEFYLKLKSSSKVSLKRTPKGIVVMDFYVYEKNTGELLRQPQITIDVNNLNDQRADLQKRINDIDAVLSDISKL